MPRIARITGQNACYHIITRGNQKQLVFLENADYERYLYLLTKYKNRFKGKLYSFCLMPNHVHLILEVAAPNNLTKIMHRLNARHKKVGHLWQDRFKSKMIEKDAAPIFMSLFFLKSC